MKNFILFGGVALAVLVISRTVLAAPGKGGAKSPVGQSWYSIPDDFGVTDPSSWD